MQIIQGTAELRTAIKALSTNAKAVNAEIHRVAVSCLAHVRDHSDWTPAAELLNALPNGTRVKALAFWFSHFSTGKLRFKADKGAYTGSLAKARTAEDFKVADSMLTTFGELTAEKDPTVTTTKRILGQLVRGSERSEFNTDGVRVATPASVAFCAALSAFGEKLLATPEFSALLAEERALTVKASKVEPVINLTVIDEGDAVDHEIGAALRAIG